MKIVFIRHGQTPANVSTALDTCFPGLPLTELGQQQARNLAERWVDEVAVAPAVMRISPLQRTRMTAQPLIDRFGEGGTGELSDIKIARGIREIRSGDIEMNPGIVDGRIYHGTVRNWILGDLDQRMPGGENGHEVIARALPDIAEALLATDRQGGEVVALVMHGAIIRFLTSVVSRGDGVVDYLRGRFMDNTGTTLFEVPEETLRSLRSELNVDALKKGLTLVHWNDEKVSL